MMAQLVSWTEPAFHLVSTPGTGGTSVPFMPCGKPFGTTGICRGRVMLFGVSENSTQIEKHYYFTLPWPSPPPGRLGTTPDEMPQGFVTGEWPGAIHGWFLVML